MSLGPAYVFLSYSHDDIGYVDKLAKSLEKRGIAFWKDSEIDYGDAWPDVIEDHLDQSAAVVVVMSVNSKRSEWVKNELTRAQRLRLPIFPLLLSGDAWLALESTQHADVSNSKLPPNRFYERLASATRDRKGPEATPDLAAWQLPAVPSIAEGATSIFSKLVRPMTGLNPVDASAFYKRGLARSKLRDYKGAIADYDEVIHLNAAYADVFDSRGTVRTSELGDQAGATVDHEEAIRLNPQIGAAFYNRGLARFKLGDYEAAIADYDEAIRLNYNYESAKEAKRWAVDALKEKQA